MKNFWKSYGNSTEFQRQIRRILSKAFEERRWGGKIAHSKKFLTPYKKNIVKSKRRIRTWESPMRRGFFPSPTYTPSSVEMSRLLPLPTRTVDYRKFPSNRTMRFSLGSKGGISRRDEKPFGKPTPLRPPTPPDISHRFGLDISDTRSFSSRTRFYILHVKERRKGRSSLMDQLRNTILPGQTKYKVIFERGERTPTFRGEIPFGRPGPLRPPDPVEIAVHPRDFTQPSQNLRNTTYEFRQIYFTDGFKWMKKDRTEHKPNIGVNPPVEDILPSKFRKQTKSSMKVEFVSRNHITLKDRIEIPIGRQLPFTPASPFLTSKTTLEPEEESVNLPRNRILLKCTDVNSVPDKPNKDSVAKDAKDSKPRGEKESSASPEIKTDLLHKKCENPTHSPSSRRNKKKSEKRENGPKEERVAAKRDVVPFGKPPPLRPPTPSSNPLKSVKKGFMLNRTGVEEIFEQENTRHSTESTKHSMENETEQSDSTPKKKVEKKVSVLKEETSLKKHSEFCERTGSSFEISLEVLNKLKDNSISGSTRDEDFKKSSGGTNSGKVSEKLDTGESNCPPDAPAAQSESQKDTQKKLVPCESPPSPILSGPKKNEFWKGSDHN